MNRKAFKLRMQELKSYRELNPDKGYLEFKAYKDGGLTDHPTYRPQIPEVIPRTFTGGRKWEDLNKYELLNIRSGKTEEGRPLEKGLEIVSPEFEVLTGIRGIANAVKSIPGLGKPRMHNSADLSSTQAGLPNNSPNAMNRVFEGLSVFGPKATEILTELGKVYRSTRKDQLKDILETGYVRPKSGKLKGGHLGETFWSSGNSNFTTKGEVVLETKPGILGIGNTRLPVTIDDLDKIYLDGKNILDGKIHGYKDGGETRKTIKTLPPYPGEHNGTRLNPYTGLPLATGLAKPFLDLEDAANFTPIGDAITVKDMGQAVANKNWKDLGWASLGLVPFVPRITKRARKTTEQTIEKALARSAQASQSEPARSIPKVNRAAVNAQMDNIKNTKYVPHTGGTSVKVFEEAIDQRNRVLELIDEPGTRGKAATIDELYGTEYGKVYDDLSSKYNGTSAQYLNDLPYPKTDGEMWKDAYAEFNPINPNQISLNQRFSSPIPDHQYSFRGADNMDPGLMQHELGHMVDFKAGKKGSNVYTDEILSNPKKFKPLDKLRDLSLLTNWKYLLDGSEIKSHMNQYRRYLINNNKIDRQGNYKFDDKLFKKDLIESPYSNLQQMFKMYKSSKLFIKDFNNIPVVNNKTNNANIA